MIGDPLRTSFPGRSEGAESQWAGGGGNMTTDGGSSSIAWVRYFGFMRTRIVSSFGLIMFDPARVAAPPTIVRTTYIPNVRNVTATDARIPLRTELSWRP